MDTNLSDKKAKLLKKVANFYDTLQNMGKGAKICDQRPKSKDKEPEKLKEEDLRLLRKNAARETSAKKASKERMAVLDNLKQLICTEFASENLHSLATKPSVKSLISSETKTGSDLRVHQNASKSPGILKHCNQKNLNHTHDPRSSEEQKARQLLPIKMGELINDSFAYRKSKEIRRLQYSTNITEEISKKSISKNTLETLAKSTPKYEAGNNAKTKPFTIASSPEGRVNEWEKPPKRHGVKDSVEAGPLPAQQSAERRQCKEAPLISAHMLTPPQNKSRDKKRDESRAFASHNSASMWTETGHSNHALGHSDERITIHDVASTNYKQLQAIKQSNCEMFTTLGQSIGRGKLLLESYDKSKERHVDHFRGVLVYPDNQLEPVLVKVLSDERVYIKRDCCSLEQISYTVMDEEMFKDVRVCNYLINNSREKLVPLDKLPVMLTVIQAPFEFEGFEYLSSENVSLICPNGKKVDGFILKDREDQAPKPRSTYFQEWRRKSTFTLAISSSRYSNGSRNLENDPPATESREIKIELDELPRRASLDYLLDDIKDLIIESKNQKAQSGRHMKESCPPILCIPTTNSKKKIGDEVSVPSEKEPVSNDFKFEIKHDNGDVLIIHLEAEGSEESSLRSPELLAWPKERAQIGPKIELNGRSIRTTIRQVENPSSKNLSNGLKKKNTTEGFGNLHFSISGGAHKIFSVLLKASNSCSVPAVIEEEPEKVLEPEQKHNSKAIKRPDSQEQDKEKLNYNWNVNRNINKHRYEIPPIDTYDCDYEMKMISDHVPMHRLLPVLKSLRESPKSMDSLMPSVKASVIPSLAAGSGMSQIDRDSIISAIQNKKEDQNMVSINFSELYKNTDGMKGPVESGKKDQSRGQIEVAKDSSKISEYQEMIPSILAGGGPNRSPRRRSLKSPEEMKKLKLSQSQEKKEMNDFSEDSMMIVEQGKPDIYKRSRFGGEKLEEPPHRERRVSSDADLDHDPGKIDCVYEDEDFKRQVQQYKKKQECIKNREKRNSPVSVSTPPPTCSPKSFYKVQVSNPVHVTKSGSSQKPSPRDPGHQKTAVPENSQEAEQLLQRERNVKK